MKSVKIISTDYCPEEGPVSEPRCCVMLQQVVCQEIWRLSQHQESTDSVRVVTSIAAYLYDRNETGHVLPVTY